MSRLFSPFPLRSLTLRNRIAVSPMCQYSSDDGFASDWHLVHLGGFATGGAALVISEATAVTANGRISPHDLGLWKDAHVEMLARITHFVRAQGACAGVQLAHAGRKASTKRPWERGGTVSVAEGGWTDVMAPSAIAFSEAYPMPHALSEAGVAGVIAAFREAAVRALAAGFEVIELHAAHGYLLHQFLSPLSNQRTDAWGGSFDHRVRLTIEVVDAIRTVWPERLPLFVRLSATDWVEGGWTVADTVRLSALLRTHGVDLVDCSSGGLAHGARVSVGPGYQVPFARQVRAESGMPTGAVGLITDAQQAEAIIAAGDADLVFLARELLRQPRWPLAAAHALGAEEPWPKQYERAKLPKST